MSIARNTAFNVVGAIIPLAVSLLTVPIYLKVVGIDRYGVMALFWALLGLMGFLNLGMGPSVTQRMATLSAAPQEQRAEVFWAALALNLALGVVGGAIAYLGGSAYFRLVSDKATEFAREIEQALPFLAMIAPLTIVSSVLTGALQGRSEFLKLNVINGFGSVMMTTAPLVVAILIGPQLKWLVAAGLSAKVIELIWLAAACRLAIPLSRVHRPSWAVSRHLLRFGGWVSLSSLLGVLLETTDRFVLGSLRGLSAVSAYSIPYSLVSKLTILPLSLSRALLPHASATVDRKQGEQVEINSVRALTCVISPGSILLLALLGPFMHVWLGDLLAEKSRPVADILVLGFWANSLAHIPFVILQAMGKPQSATRLQMIYLIPYFTLLYFAVKWFGPVGAAFAWAARSFWDPILFAMTGTARRVFPIVAPSGALVVVSGLIALNFNWRSTSYWLALATLFAMSLLAAAAIAPTRVPLRFKNGNVEPPR